MGSWSGPNTISNWHVKHVSLAPHVFAPVGSLFRIRPPSGGAPRRRGATSGGASSRRRRVVVGTVLAHVTRTRSEGAVAISATLAWRTPFVARHSSYLRATELDETVFRRVPRH